MIFSRDYSRAILTLRQDSSRFSADRKGIFGRSVVEVINGKAKVMLYAQGFKNMCVCSLYIICEKDGDFIPLKTVLVNIKGGRAEVKWDFNPDNISGSGFRLEDVRALTVMTEDKESILTAFFDKPVNWQKVKNDKIKTETKAAQIDTEVKKSKKLDKEVKTGHNNTDVSEKSGKSNVAVGDGAEPKKKGVDFTDVVNRFRRDMDELRRYAYMQSNQPEIKDNKNRTDFNVSHLFSARENGGANFNDEAEYRKICLRDLPLIDEYSYKLANNPTVRSCCLKGELLIGREGDNIFLCVPDEYPNFRGWSRLGFTEKKCGYRIMKINKE